MRNGKTKQEMRITEHKMMTEHKNERIGMTLISSRDVIGTKLITQYHKPSYIIFNQFIKNVLLVSTSQVIITIRFAIKHYSIVKIFGFILLVCNFSKYF
jgi:hypothetical protein